MNTNQDNAAVAAYFHESARILGECATTILPELREAGELICRALESGGKILVCGNGGSAADSQHLAAELSGRFLKHRRAFAAIALTTDTSAITSISNDYGFDFVFSRQIEAVARPGDVLVAISTSGKSPSILNAIKAAQKAGTKTVGLTGQSGGEMPPICNACIRVPSDYTPHIQESHGVIIHILCKTVEAWFNVQG